MIDNQHFLIIKNDNDLNIDDEFLKVFYIKIKDIILRFLKIVKKSIAIFGCSLCGNFFQI